MQGKATPIQQLDKDLLRVLNDEEPLYHMRTHGKDAYSLHASQELQKGQPVAQWVGRLTTEEEFEKEIKSPDEGLWSFQVPAKTLKPYGYKGGNLEIEALKYSNLTR